MDLITFFSYPTGKLVDLMGVGSLGFILFFLISPFVFSYQIDGPQRVKVLRSTLWLVPWLSIGTYWYYRETKGFSVLYEFLALVSLLFLFSLVLLLANKKYNTNLNSPLVLLATSLGFYLSYTAPYLGK